MRLLLLNALCLALVAVPQGLLYWAKERWWWDESKVVFASIILWIISMALIYLYVLPHYGLEPNRNVLDGSM